MYPQATYDPSARRKGIIFAAASVTLLTIGIIFFYWFSSHGFIKVTTEGAPGSTTVRFINQDDKKVTEVDSASGSTKKLLRKGQYQVQTMQGNNNAVAFVTSGGFLGTKAVTAKLQPERSRTYVGDGPSRCMQYSGGILASYDCNGQFTAVQVHVPATAKSPTFLQKNPTKSDGIIEGVVKTPQGTVLLSKPSHPDADQGSPHAVYLLGQGFKLNDRTVLNDLKDNESYGLRAFESGFMVYDTSYKKAWYYSAINAQPAVINLVKPLGSWQAYSITAKGDKLAVAYSQDNGASEVIVQDRTGNTNTTYDFSGAYDTVSLCGTNKLCLSKEKVLDIYDISTNKSARLVRLENVEAFNADDSDLAFVQDKKLVRLNLQDMTGTIDYSFGDYNFCGLQSADDGYLVCAIDSKNRKVALHINRQQASDEIDKKIATVLKLPEVKAISVYGHSIFISPNAGELSYQANLKRFGYDPARLASTGDKINQAVASAGIDRSVYTVTNTLQH